MNVCTHNACYHNERLTSAVVWWWSLTAPNLWNVTLSISNCSLHNAMPLLFEPLHWFICTLANEPSIRVYWQIGPTHSSSIQQNKMLYELVGPKLLLSKFTFNNDFKVIFVTNNFQIWNYMPYFVKTFNIRWETITLSCILFSPVTSLLRIITSCKT